MPAHEIEKEVYQFSSKDTLKKIRSKVRQIVREGNCCKIAVFNQTGEEVVDLLIPATMRMADAAIEHLAVAWKDAPAFLSDCTITVVKKKDPEESGGQAT